MEWASAGWESAYPIGDFNGRRIARKGHRYGQQTMKPALFVLLMVASTTMQPYAPSQQNQRHEEQINFGAEGDFEKPVPLPLGALQSLRESEDPNDTVQACAQEEGISATEIPATWFAASVFRLSRGPSSGLIVRGEHLCLRGAHISQFWVLAKSGTKYTIVFRGRADGLCVLPTRTNGFRDLQMFIVTQAGANVDTVTFRYSQGQYRVVSHQIDHN